MGEVLGSTTRTGTAAYDAMVRMAQHWSLRYPLVDGQGNFGSIDGDSPAAMRYTEARLKDRRGGDRRPGQRDGGPAPQLRRHPGRAHGDAPRIPTLLVNGASGIAVGMATNMAPHNLSGSATPPSPTSRTGTSTTALPWTHQGAGLPLRAAPSTASTGAGGLRDRPRPVESYLQRQGPASRETSVAARPSSWRRSFMVNKADLVKKCADLVNDKKVEGISDIRDESDRKASASCTR